MNNGYTKDYTRGDHLRLLNALKGINRGVYTFNYGCYKDSPRYRAVFKNKKGKVITAGYSADKNEATMIYMCAFEAEFSYSPYLHDEIGGGI